MLDYLMQADFSGPIASTVQMADDSPTAPQVGFNRVFHIVLRNEARVSLITNQVEFRSDR